MDIQNKTLLYIKGFLFVLIGVVASTAILLETGSWKIAFLLAMAIWGFARAYYFAFYVVEHYIDSSRRYAGLFDFACSLLRRKNDEK